MVLPSQQLGAYATRIVDLVARHQLPAIYPVREGSVASFIWGTFEV
jgi:hypothetical protein